ncbi:AraC family transcriptional regulator [filamentous cyanobacterium LEGE 11480]|uniref:AraC family transcriptional regulator n=1 Tax=Romeriopsis navalis LEGE 11480 TaxID=2777977 RepID=A0A928VIN2_9CYAN|nr:helix-turn-helix transcriptional regulator [Romeriopsis navalis]MBE9029301.1 AraC family transcriptional regulator [Romeriopsis navalis LEGE 11480]
MDTLSLANVQWSPAVNSHFEVLRLKDLHKRELPDDHDPWQPHRLYFHALILFTHGQGTHGVDFIDYPVKAGTLIHICANQVHHFGHAPELDAFMVVFVPTALPTNLLGLSTSISSPISWSTIQHVWPSVTSLAPDQAQSLQQHIELLEKYKKNNSSPQPSAQYLLWSVIAFASQAAVESEKHYQRRVIEPRFLEFVELLEQSFESCRNVKWYAEQMNCSAKTLYRICIAAVGKSPKVIANERVAVEAQRRLLFGKTTVKEVGCSLGFEETTNFVKFFRRLVGQNPDEFRMGAKF